MVLKRFLLPLFLCFMLIHAANGEIVTLPSDNSPGLPCDFDQYGTDNGYEDPSISVALYSGKSEDTEYLYAIVQIATPAQLRTAQAYKVNSGRTAKATRIAEANNAVVAVNGDYADFEPNGYVVRQGKYYYNRAYRTLDVLIIDQNGDFHVITEPTSRTVEAWLSDQPEIEVVNSFSFGPVIISDGQRAYDDLNTAGNASEARGHLRFARTVICQLEGELSYLILCCQGDQDGKGKGFTYEEIYECLRQIEQEQNIAIKVAYNLDGGYSSAMVMNNQKINWPENGINREISDIVYFASAWQKE